MTFQVVGIFCEDIREEKSGQLTLIGTVPDNVVLPPAPSNLGDRKAVPIIPKLGLYVRVHAPLDQLPKPMKLKLLFPDGTNLEIGELDKGLITKARDEALAKHLPVAGMVMTAVLQGFQVGMPGVVRAVLENESDAYLCAFLNLVTPDPIASAQPALQSPPAA